MWKGALGNMPYIIIYVCPDCGKGEVITFDPIKHEEVRQDKVSKGVHERIHEEVEKT
jgi:hypothetical protein